MNIRAPRGNRHGVSILDLAHKTVQELIAMRDGNDPYGNGGGGGNNNYGNGGRGGYHGGGYQHGNSGHGHGRQNYSNNKCVRAFVEFTDAFFCDLHKCKWGALCLCVLCSCVCAIAFVQLCLWI